MAYRKRGGAELASSIGRFALAARRRWGDLPVDRRQRLQGLVRKSGGRPAQLSPAERQELGALLRELRLIALVRESALEAGRRRR